jgi:hypothetical protein
MKLKRVLQGGETGGDVLAVQRALNAAPSKTTIEVTKVYDDTTKRRMRSFRQANNLPAGSHFTQQALDELEQYMDAYGKMRYTMFRVPPPVYPWSNVGAVTKRRFVPVVWDKSLLDYAPTHDTSGIPLFPAVDLAWGAGVSMFAPDDCVVSTRDTSANPGEAVFLTLACELRIWMAHIDRDYPLGHRFRKGDFIGKTVDTEKGGGPHGHVGVNGEHYLGKGKQFKYGRDGNGPDYTLGSPTYREQLERTLL